ncbi:MAG: VCBS repeat-containing protein [Pseudomonadota bacterium]
MLRGAALACVLSALPLISEACTASPLIRDDLIVPGSMTQTKQGEPVAAWYEDLTDRYPHAALGDALEPTTLRVYGAETSASCGLSLTTDATHVFEDVAPRLIDLDGDGRNEIITVRSHQSKGAQLAIFGQRNDALNLLATTPYIGTRNRWLAPLGAADLDGDGRMEVAYIDRPHLAKTLRIWRFEKGDLEEVAAIRGLTNHRIGERDIAGGIRRCNGSPEMILASGDWSKLLALRWDGKDTSVEVIGNDTSRPAFAAAMKCPN